MSDDAVDKFFDEMVSPASTPAESTPPDMPTAIFFRSMPNLVLRAALQKRAPLLPL